MTALTIELIALFFVAVDFFGFAETVQRWTKSALTRGKRVTDWFDGKSDQMARLLRLVLLVGVVAAAGFAAFRFISGEVGQGEIENYVWGVVINVAVPVVLLWVAAAVVWGALFFLWLLFTVLALPKRGVVGSLGLSAAVAAVLYGYAHLGERGCG